MDPSTNRDPTTYYIRMTDNVGSRFVSVNDDDLKENDKRES